MTKTLFLIESPGKVKKISSILGSSYAVCASIGSVTDLPVDKIAVDIRPEDDGQYTFVPHYEVKSDRRVVIRRMKQLLGTASRVILATDPDREGESIAEALCSVLSLKSPERVTFNEITREAIQRALQRPRVIDQNLVRAQRARRVLDRLVGYLISPLLGRGRSAGRVQSVVLRMIIERIREVEERLENLSLVLKATASFTEDIRHARLTSPFPCTSSRALLEWILETGGLLYRVSSIKTDVETRSPPPPFTTSTLQSESWSLLHKNAEQTMRSAQDLYQKGLITYIRTDSTAMSQGAVDQIREYVLHEYGEAFHCPRSWCSSSKNAQNAHECIRVTDINETSVEDPLYQLIWKRTLASQMSAARFNVQHITLESNDVTFSATAKELLFEGFLRITGNLDVQETVRSVVEGQTVRLVEMEASECVRPGPVPFTVGTLIKEMEKTGVGRPSTYSAIIKTLQEERDYVRIDDFPGKQLEVDATLYKDAKITVKKKKLVVGNQKKSMIPTDVGREVYQFMMEHFGAIMCVDLTSRMEAGLDDIAGGTADWQSTVSQFFSIFYPTVLRLQAAPKNEGCLGTDKDGCRYSLFTGKFGLSIRKDHPVGDGTYVPSFSSVKEAPKSIEEAVSVCSVYRFLGMYRKSPIFLVRGAYGLYLRHGSTKRIKVQTENEEKVTFEGAKALLCGKKK